jgi:hypothetical protein
MTLLQILNIDSLKKVITDSLLSAQKQQFNSVDYINKIDAFYTSAWTKLAILFALVGVLVPLIINYIQVKRNEKDQENIKVSIKTELQAEINTLLENKLTKIQHAAEGVSYQIQSDILFDKLKFREAFGETVNAMTCFYIGDDYPNFLSSKDELLIRMKKIKKEDAESLKEEFGEYYDINSLLEKLEGCDDEKYSCHCTQIKLEVKKLQ